VGQPVVRRHAAALRQIRRRVDLLEHASGHGLSPATKGTEARTHERTRVVEKLIGHGVVTTYFFAGLLLASDPGSEVDFSFALNHIRAAVREAVSALRRPEAFNTGDYKLGV